MSIGELKAVFESERVPQDLYSLSGGLPNESYCTTVQEAIQFLEEH